MPDKDYRQESKRPWGTTNDGNLTMEQVKFGAMLRIADSLEKMEKPFARLISDAEWQKERAERLSKSLTKAEHVIAGLKGYIRRTKKEAK